MLTFNPQMLTLAREARGFSQKELAAEAGVTQGRISKIEHGLLDAPDELVERFAEVLGFERRFFIESSPVLGLPYTFFRKRLTTPAKTLAKVSAWLNIYGLMLRKLMLSVEFEPQRKIPRIDPDAHRGDAAEVARMVRAAWNVPRGPIANMVDLIESAGGLIIPMDFGSHKIDAISQAPAGLPPLFFVNKHLPSDRMRFTLAHELGHLVMHDGDTGDIEDEADAFAAEFLTPASEVRGSLTGLRLDRAVQLKLHWKVSMGALIYRAKALNAITANQAKYLWIQMSQNGWRTKEPVDIQAEEPKLLRDLVRCHLEDLGYSSEDLARAVHLRSPDEACEKLFVPAAPKPRPPLRLLRAG